MDTAGIVDMADVVEVVVDVHNIAVAAAAAAEEPTLPHGQARHIGCTG